MCRERETKEILSGVSHRLRIQICSPRLFLHFTALSHVGKPHPAQLKQTQENQLEILIHTDSKRSAAAGKTDFWMFNELLELFFFFLDCISRSATDTNRVLIWAQIKVVWPVFKVTVNHIHILAQEREMRCYRGGWYLTESLSTSPLSTRSRYSCLSSLSSREGRPGYMVDPPDNTMCL